MSNDIAEDPKGAKPKDSFMVNTLKRVGTAVVLLPGLLWALFLGPKWVFGLIGLLCVTIAAFELARMTMPKETGLQTYSIAAALALCISFVWGNPLEPMLGFNPWPNVVILLTMVGTLFSLWVPLPYHAAGHKLAWLVGGPFYVGLCFGTCMKLHQLPNGGGWVTLAMMFAWMSDTGAYFAGRFFGKRKLYPEVSPAKTLEGSIGGVIGAVGGALWGHFHYLKALPLGPGIVLAVIAAVFGQAGDLVESLVKRSAGFKDSGDVFPGHGGMLDRVDALMFTSTVTWLYCEWFI